MNYSIIKPYHAQSNHGIRSNKEQEKRHHIYLFTEIISIFAAQVK